MKYKRADGRTVRPTLVVLDDPQTDESARVAVASVRRARASWRAQCWACPVRARRSRESCPVRSSAPATWPTPSSTATGTPSGTAQRTKLVYSFPTDESPVEAVCRSPRREPAARQRRRGGDRVLPRNRAAMDEGAVVAWPERFNHDELSADPARHEPAAAGRGRVLRRIPERAAPGRDGIGRRTDRRADRRQAQPDEARRGAGRRQPRHRLHRRAGESSLLGGLRVGGRLHRLRPRLRRVPRPEAAVLHAAGCPPHADLGDAQRRRRGGDLRRAGDARPARSSAGPGDATTARTCGSNAA
ncbi:MAG: hypothetical protein KatS3mg108_0046 [Isosphaeraceae bacterium]|nr:MAG: hypothetical protein KatS3mg108_0046 [Isosphaeraceae bacterium]